MEKIVYRIPIVIFILDIICVILSYFWVNCNYIVEPMILITLISFGIFVINIKKFNLYDDIFTNGSGFMILIAFICIIYAFVNFIVSIAYLYKGGPQIVNGLYYLNNHGSFKQITESEYYKLLLAENRLKSGTIVVFAVIPLASCFCKLKQMKQTISKNN